MNREINASQAADQRVRTWSMQKKRREERETHELKVETLSIARITSMAYNQTIGVHLDAHELKVETLSNFQIHYQA